MSANEPAFPITGKYEGLTKREYFAAMALNGLTSNLDMFVSAENCKSYADCAFALADAMIEKSQVQS